MKYLIAFVILVSSATSAHELGSNLNPIAFGNDQTIVTLDKLIFEPLIVDGFKPGAEVALIRGDFKSASESILRIPPGYLVPQHSHTSDEVYMWLKGPFSLIAESGEESKFTEPTYISFPGNAPTHALKCGDNEPCYFYLRYTRPFDVLYK